MRRALTQLPWIAPVLLTAWLLFKLLTLFAARVGYPFDIEWMEGGMLVHVWRLRQGLPLYAAPSADFIPYIYPPFYPFVLSLLGEPSYAIGRTVSLVGALAAAAAAVFAVRREGAPWGAAIAAGGLFLSCYDESGTFYDIVRADAFAIGLGAWSLVLARVGTRRALVASGLLLTLTFFTKHNYAAFGVPIALWLWGTRGWREALWFGAWSAGPALIGLIGLEIATDGYFLTYLVGVPTAHPLVAERAWPLSEKELLTCLMWTTGAAALVGLAQLRAFGRGAAFWLSMLGMAVGLSILMRAHHGGYINVLMPGHWALAVCGAAVLGTAARRWEHPVSAIAVAGLLSWQLWDGRWDDSRMIPTAEDRAAGEKVIAVIAHVEGEVFAPQFAWYPAMAGKTPSLPLISLWDIDHKRGPLKKDAAVVKKALAEHRWAAVLTSAKDIKYELPLYYTKSQRIPLPATAMNTRSGYRVKPEWIWLPKEVNDAPSSEEEAEEPASTADPEAPGG